MELMHEIQDDIKANEVSLNEMGKLHDAVDGIDKNYQASVNPTNNPISMSPKLESEKEPETHASMQQTFVKVFMPDQDILVSGRNAIDTLNEQGRISSACNWQQLEASVNNDQGQKQAN